MTKIVVVTSGKGGVGKTTTSASFATGLAQRGKKVAVIDFDVGLRNLDLIMGCERRVVFDFVNVIQGEASLRQALIKDKTFPNLHILAASQTRDKEALTPEGVEKVLNDLRSEGLLLRRINIRQVEGEGFQAIPIPAFNAFKSTVRDTIDAPLLKELFPTGQVLHGVHWEAHDGRTRLPVHLTDAHTSPELHGRAGVTFGRQLGAYPILIGASYKIPLETVSSVVVTGHGARSITGVEVGMDPWTATEKQLAAIPGLGAKSAWSLVSARAKAARKRREAPPFESVSAWFHAAQLSVPPLADLVLQD